MTGDSNSRSSQAEAEVLELKNPLTSEQCEKWLAGRSRSAGRLIVRAGDLERAALLGDALLLSVLAAARQDGTELEARLGKGLSGSSATSWRRRQKLFSETLTGYGLAHYADRIVTSQGTEIAPELLALQREILDKTYGVVGSGYEKAAVFEISEDPYAATPPLDDIWMPSDSNNTVNSALMRLLYQGLLGLQKLEGREVPRLRRIREFVGQATDNVRDHATENLSSRKIPGIRYVSFRRAFATGDEFLGSRREIAETHTPLGDYLRRLSGRLETEAKEKGTEVDWTLVEVTIGDPGIGIAGQMAEDVGVYDQPFENELKHFEAAFPLTGTSKLDSGGRPKPGAGRGLAIMTRALFVLGGLGIYRSGRVRAFKHFLSESGSRARLHDSFDEEDSQTYAFSGVNQAPLGRIAGTIVTLLVPWGLETRPI